MNLTTNGKCYYCGRQVSQEHAPTCSDTGVVQPTTSDQLPLEFTENGSK